jgi:hypothetical protein
MSLPRLFLRSGQVPDRLLELRTEEPPGPPELSPGEDAPPRVLLDRVGLQVDQRRYIGDRQDILARDRG